MVRRICEITVTLDFNFRLMYRSREDVSFNCICLNVLKDSSLLVNVVQKNRLETPFKGNNVKTAKNPKWELLFVWENQKFCEH